ncbi:hypothetical protein KZZ52_31130 [Dactylosporangium sp. AC04546]|uniref:hypothetical protein n=1 Tax=Dactylosporangium sp. AC04546 TaxID=2862460 RepID=UPI001EDD0ED0|nr:hypothetical protein [Dactylosporangium sp. AC04546]WVK78448.1 hypothetical protein KZZ52_31130 [Dactylosporangium sp. AC04546]
MLAFALSATFPAAATAAILAGAVRAAADPLWTTWLVRETTPANRATVLSAVGMAGALGEITGGPPAGRLGTRFSVARALLACAAVSAASVAFLAAAGRRSARPADVTVVRREADTLR